jgi:DNA sulfur modification protein DndC
LPKHKIKGSALSRHSSLPNTYMPIESWSADEVWEYLIGAPCPWGGDNWQLFELYKGSNQGECPLVIDTNTPSCGNSRFGCWTCTVVSEDKALHGLIESGDTWMQPLLDFRNALFESTKPEKKPLYRNYKRRTGRVSYMRDALNDDAKDKQEKKHIPGPYWMEQRQVWVKELLEIQKKLNDEGNEITLIKEEELQAIRQEWIHDPNEPDWMDSLPKIYYEIYGDSIDWIEDDTGVFTASDTELLKKLAQEQNVPAELVMKLLETEISIMGLGNRRGILAKLGSILSRDWESLDEIKSRHASQLENPWKSKIDDINNQLSAVANL